MVAESLSKGWICAVQRLFDVLAVVTTVGPLGSIKRKSDQSELIRRDVTLLDSTCDFPALAYTVRRHCQKVLRHVYCCHPQHVLWWNCAPTHWMQ